MAKNGGQVGGQIGGQVILAAGVLGLCILGGAFLMSRSVDRATDKLAGLEGALRANAAAGGEAAQVARVEPQRRRGPDPNRVYEVNTEGSPASGPADAKVTLVEFSDFQCPFCARVGPTLEQVKKEYGDKVRVVFKHLPLSIHPKAPAAHAAALAAHQQGKFWEMHDKIFANQREMSPDQYEKYAQELGLDLEKYKKDVTSASLKAAIERDKSEATRLGVSGTPAFFINGKYMSGAKPYAEFKKMIDAALAS